ncbi:MAG: hypothetical protein VCA55_06765 [Verrucomicrobiales bacterium]
MNTQKMIKPLYVVAALYDAALGVAFIVGGKSLFDWLAIPVPNHLGYIQFSAALLLVFALMSAAIARDPVKNRNLIPYGILLKISYCSVVLFHWINPENQGVELQNWWKGFCVADGVFLILFFCAWRTLGKSAGEEA